MSAAFRRMNASAGSIATGMRVLINERLNALQQTTRDAQRALAWQAAALIPAGGQPAGRGVSRPMQYTSALASKVSGG